MPYKLREDMLKHNRKYYQEHKEEISIQKKEYGKKFFQEYYPKNRSRYYKTDRRNRLRYKKIQNKYFGNKCWNCGIIVFNYGKARHEINGLKHSNKDCFCAFHLERLILLCRSCHTTFHVLMKIGYSFEEILIILKWKGGQS